MNNPTNNVLGTPRPIHVTERNERDAIEMLQKRPKDKPFALTVAFFAPHSVRVNSPLLEAVLLVLVVLSHHYSLPTFYVCSGTDTPINICHKMKHSACTRV